MTVSEDKLDEVLAIEAALDRLRRWAPRQCMIVEMRFFGGLTEEEIAEILGIAPADLRKLLP